VAPDELAAACCEEKPSLVALSSVNGHGRVEAIEALDALRGAGCVPGTPIVIGGKLTTSVDSDSVAQEQLLDAGFSGVFTGASALAEFDAFLIRNGLLAKPGAVFETVVAKDGEGTCRSH
jgi:methylmalonyl-CoA mutase cobalamin-binding subunit